MVNITKIGLSLFLSSTLSFGADVTVLQEKTNLMLNGKNIGYSPILTPIDTVTQSKDKTTIKIKGFRLENYPQMVVRDMKRGELYAEFEEEDMANKAFSVIKKYEDDYGEVWHEVEGEFTVASKQISKAPAKLYLNAKKTYERTCSMCHHLPASTAYTVNQWPQQIESMMEQVALDDATKNLIVKYLQQHASDAK
jgi:trimethylamine-N-oxide reductase cytochrome c-type subunit TorC